MKKLSFFLVLFGLTVTDALANQLPAGNPGSIQIKQDLTNFGPLTKDTLASYAAHNTIANGLSYDPRDPAYGAICGGYNLFTADGSTTTFSYTIPFTGSSPTDNTNFMVFYEPTNGSGTATILTTSQFSVTGVNSGSGGTITLASAPPSGNTLIVVHDDSAGLVSASIIAAISGGFISMPDGCTIYGSQANGTRLAEGAQVIGQSFTPNYTFQGTGSKPILRVIAPTGSAPAYGINVGSRSQQFFEGFEITTNVPGANALGFLAVPVLMGTDTSAGGGGGQSPGITAQYMTFNAGSVGFGSPIGGTSGYLFSVLRFNNFTANNAGIYGPLSDQQIIGNNFNSNGAFGSFGSAGGMVIGPQQAAPGGSGAARIEFNRFEFNSEGIVFRAAGTINMEGNQFDGNSFCGMDFFNATWSNINVTGGWFHGNANGGGNFPGSTTAGRDADICFNGTSSGQGLTFDNVDFLTNYNIGNVNPLGTNGATTPSYVIDMNASGLGNDYIEFRGGMMLNVTGNNGAYVTDFAAFRQGRPPHFKVDVNGQAVQGELVNGKMPSQARGLPTSAWTNYNAYGDNVTYYSSYATQTLYPFLLNADLVGALTNLTVPFGFDCDVVDQDVFPHSAPSQTGNPLVSWLPSGHDPAYGNPSSGSVDSVHEAITHQCRIAGLTWMSIPSTYKVLGQSSACVQAGGSSWSDSAQYGGSYGIVSDTNGDAVTCTISSNGGPVYFWYGLKENDGGTFNYSIDGGPTTSLPTNGSNEFSFPVSSHTSVAGIRLPVLAAGNHSVTFTVTSSTSSSNTVTVYGLGTPPGKSYLGGNPTVFYGGQVPELNNSPYPTAVTIYNNDEMTDAYQLHADGLAVDFVNVQNYVNSTTDMSGGADYYVPNPTGQQHLRDAFEGEMQFLPNARSPQVDPRSFGASCNTKHFINTFGSPDNHVTTTQGSPVISVNGYTFVDGPATQTGGGDVGKVIAIKGHVDQGPATYIVSVNTVNNTATLGENMQATRSDSFADMGGYPSNPNDPSTAQDDTAAIQAASQAAAANGQSVFLPNNCLVHNLSMNSGILLEGSMGGTDYNSSTTANTPVTNLYCATSGYADDSHFCISLAGTHETRYKDFHLDCGMFPALSGGTAASFRGVTLAGIGAEQNIALDAEGVVLDHVSFSLCPISFGVPFGVNQPVNFTASITGNVMTVTSLDSTNFSSIYGINASPDWLATGRTVTGASIPANTKILTATISGDVGTYTLSNSATVSSESMTSPANSVFLSGQGRFNQFSNGGIAMNGDFSDFADVGSVFTGAFTKCLWLGPNTGGSTGNGADRFALERFEECNNGAIMLDGTSGDQFTGLHFQFNSGYAVETRNAWSDLTFTGGTFQGNGSSSSVAPTTAQIALGGTGTNFAIVGAQWQNANFSAGGTSKYLISTESGSNVDYVSIEGGDARNGFVTGTFNWVGNTPTHYKQYTPGLPVIDTTQSTISQPVTGGVAIGRSDSSAVTGQVELGKAGSVQGKLTLNGTTAGVVNIVTAASTASYTVTVPPTVGVAGTFWENTDGAGTGGWALPATLHPNVWNLFGTLTVANDVTDWVILPGSGTINKAYAICKTSPTGQALIFDILKSTNNGASFTSIWNVTPANKIQVASGQVAGNTSSFDTTTFNAGDIFRLDVDQIGSGAAGANCTISLISTY